MTRLKVLVTGPAGDRGLLGFIKNGLSQLGVGASVLSTSPSPAVRHALSRLIPKIPMAGWRMIDRAEKVSLASQAAQFNDRLESILAECRPDVLISLLCWGDPLYPGLLDQFGGVYKVGWLMDDPFLHTGSLAKVLETFDALYAVDGSWVDPVRLASGRPVEMLPCGACLESHRPVPKDRIPARLHCETVFVGTSYRGQSAGLVRKRLLCAIADSNLSIYGDEGWMSSESVDDPLPACYRGRELDSAEVNLVYNAARVVLNIHHPQWRLGTSLRTFAICGSGAFQLVDWRPGLEQFFDLDKEIVAYRTEDELRDKLSYYRANDGLRLRIARAGLDRVRAEHTYADRLKHILDQAQVLPSRRIRRIAEYAGMMN